MFQKVMFGRAVKRWNGLQLVILLMSSASAVVVAWYFIALLYELIY